MTDLSIYINRKRRQIRENNLPGQIIGKNHNAPAPSFARKTAFSRFSEGLFGPQIQMLKTKKISRLSRFSRLNYISSGTNSFTLRKPHHSHSSRLLVFHLSTLYNTIRIYIEIFIELISLSIQLNYRLTKEVTLKIILRLIRSQHCRLLKH